MRDRRIAERRGRAIPSLCPGIPTHTPSVGSLRFFCPSDPPEPRTRPQALGPIDRKSQCSSMVDFLLTRADRPLSPQEWPVWPRAGPSTLVWIFEGKKKNFFLLMDHPQTRAEGVLSPGNWPVCQPDTARGPTSREHPCKKNAASVWARTGSYAAVHRSAEG